MGRLFILQAALLIGGLAGALAPAQTNTGIQEQDRTGPAASDSPDPGAVNLEWAPPALAELGANAAVKSDFTLDRSMLAAAVALVPDADPGLKQAAAKLDGVSVHELRFSAARAPDSAQLEAVRAAYHLRGWKHLVSTTDAGGSARGNLTDVWLAMDGSNVRGGVVLVETPRDLTLVTVAGNLSPLDILRLRGHFGIPRFEGDRLGDSNTR